MSRPPPSTTRPDTLFPYTVVCRSILLEPLGRNTAAALASAAIVTEERWPGAVLWAMPADHVIEDEAALADALDHAADAAEAGWIVAFGIAPDRPETAFGYIIRGAPHPGHGRALAGSDFIEKLPPAVAARPLGRTEEGRVGERGG